MTEKQAVSADAAAVRTGVFTGVIAAATLLVLGLILTPTTLRTAGVRK